MRLDLFVCHFVAGKQLGDTLIRRTVGPFSSVQFNMQLLFLSFPSGFLIKLDESFTTFQLLMSTTEVTRRNSELEGEKVLSCFVLFCRVVYVQSN